MGDYRKIEWGDRLFGVLLQTPDEAGLVHDFREVIADARRANVAVAVGTDLLSLTLLTAPGEIGGLRRATEAPDPTRPCSTTRHRSHGAGA